MKEYKKDFPVKIRFDATPRVGMRQLKKDAKRCRKINKKEMEYMHVILVLISIILANLSAISLYASFNILRNLNLW